MLLPTILSALFFIMLAVLAYEDLRRMSVPDKAIWIWLAGAAMVSLLASFRGEADAMVNAAIVLAGAGYGAARLEVPGLGSADVMLFAGFAGWLGAIFALYIIAVAGVSALVHAGIMRRGHVALIPHTVLPAGVIWLTGLTL